MLFQMLRTVAWKVRALILSVLLVCILLFSAFIYYGMVSNEVTVLSQSRAEVRNFSVKDKVIKNSQSYRFVEAKKNIAESEKFLSKIEGFSDLEQSLTQAQSLPKYEQLLEVIQSKSLKFKDYVRGRSQSIEKQLIDLIKKIEVERFSKDRGLDFHQFIQGRLSKIERISNNVAISKGTKKEIKLYLDSYVQEMELLAQVVAAKEATTKEAYTFLEKFKAFSDNLEGIIGKKNEYLSLIEIGCMAVMGFSTITLLALFLVSLFGGGSTIKKLNLEVEAWLVDFSRSLYEKNTSSFEFESAEIQRNLEGLVSKYGQLQTIGELVESKLPFTALVTHKDGRIIWGNRSFSRLSEGLAAEKLSDLWRIDDEMWLGDHQIEGISEFKADDQKFEYYAVPLKNHDKYFIVFSPLARVVESQNKLLSEHLEPISESLSLILAHNFQAKTSEWKKYPEKVQNALEQITAIDSMVRSEHQKNEQRLEILLKDNQKILSDKRKSMESIDEVKTRLDSYREGIRQMKKYYVDMVEKQDTASRILVDSVHGHDKAVGLGSRILASNSQDLNTAISSLEKLEVVLSEQMAKTNDVGLSKLSLFVSEVGKGLNRLSESHNGYTRELDTFKNLKVDEYQQLSDELGKIDKQFIELIGQLYEDVVHLNYRVKGEEQHRRPSENV